MTRRPTPSRRIAADRPITVAVASGKGGTGKTLVSSQLARALADRGQRVLLVDADVEEPNVHLLLEPGALVEEPFHVTATAIDLEKCTHCGRCAEVCAFGALLVGQLEVLTVPEHCRDCRACELCCPAAAIQHYRRQVGLIRRGRAGEVALVGGEMAIGEHRAAPLIDELRTRARDFAGIVIVDCPPGTSCSAVAAVRGADLAILVTEPTPFGAHDLRLAAAMCTALGVPVEVVVNRAGLGGMRLDALLADLGVQACAEIPFDRDIAAAHATGADPTQASEPLHRAVASLATMVQRCA